MSLNCGLLSMLTVMVAYCSFPCLAVPASQIAANINIAEIQQIYNKVQTAIMKRLDKIALKDLNKAITAAAAIRTKAKAIAKSSRTQTPAKLAGPSFAGKMAKLVSNETTLSQNAQKCFDNIKNNKLPQKQAVPTESEKTAAKATFEACSLTCGDKMTTHMALTEDMCVRLENFGEPSKCTTFLDELKASKSESDFEKAEESDIMVEVGEKSDNMDCAAQESMAEKMATKKAEKDKEITKLMTDGGIAESDQADCKTALARRKCKEFREKAAMVGFQMNDKMVAALKPCTDKMDKSMEKVTATKDLLPKSAKNGEDPSMMLERIMEECRVGDRPLDPEEMNILRGGKVALKCDKVFSIVAKGKEPMLDSKIRQEKFGKFKSEAKTEELGAKDVNNPQMLLDRMETCDAVAASNKKQLTSAPGMTDADMQEVAKAMDLECCRAKERMSGGKPAGLGGRAPVCTLNPKMHGDQTPSAMKACMTGMQEKKLAPMGQEGISGDKMEAVSAAITACGLPEEQTPVMSMYSACDTCKYMNTMFKTEPSREAKALLDKYIPKLKAALKNDMNANMNGNSETTSQIDVVGQELRKETETLGSVDKNVVMIETSKVQCQFSVETALHMLPMMQAMMNAPVKLKECFKNHGQAIDGMEALDRPKLKIAINDMKVKCGLDELEQIMALGMAEEQICPKVINTASESDLTKVNEYLVDFRPELKKMTPEMAVGTMPTMAAMEVYRDKAVAKMEEGGMTGKMSEYCQCTLTLEGDGGETAGKR